MIDRITALIVIHFTLLMLDVMIKLKSQTVEEYLKASMRASIFKWGVYISYFVIQLPILGIRFYVRYMRYFSE